MPHIPESLVRFSKHKSNLSSIGEIACARVKKRIQCDKQYIEDECRIPGTNTPTSFATRLLERLLLTIPSCNIGVEFEMHSPTDRVYSWSIQHGISLCKYFPLMQVKCSNGLFCVLKQRVVVEEVWERGSRRSQILGTFRRLRETQTNVKEYYF